MYSYKYMPSKQGAYLAIPPTVVMDIQLTIFQIEAGLEELMLCSFISELT